jgi:hypothetical protein
LSWWSLGQTRPGAHAAVIWTNEGFPIDNDGSADTSGRKVGSTLDNGIAFGPGVTPRNHRTNAQRRWVIATRSGSPSSSAQ